MNIIKKFAISLFCSVLIKMCFCNPVTTSRPCQKIILGQQPGAFVPLWLLNVITLLTSVFFLIFLGIIKGLCGILCCAPVGMWGLGTLIDLPQPLARYQESSLKQEPVIYDDVGWPIHPQKGTRSVRALSRNTEFFLNTIFFITYPLAILITVCSACCFQESETEDDKPYKCINSITIDYSQSKKSNAGKMTTARTLIKKQEFEKNKDDGEVYGGDDDSEEDRENVKSETQ